MSGRSRLSAYEKVVNQKPGRSSSVIAAPADQVAALEDERPEAGLGQVGAVGQAVVAATDDDRVVGPVGLRLARGGAAPSSSRPRPSCPWACQAVLRSGLNSGVRATYASKYS